MGEQTTEKKAKVTYRGWPGHFCAAASCDFRLNTLVELGDIRIVVSTVGLYRPGHVREIREVGVDRYYETMAFHAHRTGEFWDADVRREVAFESPWAWSKPDDEWAANKGHIAVVEEIARRLEAGETFPTEEHGEAETV